MLLFLLACNQDQADTYIEMNNFFLIDVNLNSETYLDAVSPNSLRGKGTAWYFGHST